MHITFSPSCLPSFLGLTGLFALVSAQTYTDCNPTSSRVMSIPVVEYLVGCRVANSLCVSLPERCPPDAGLQAAQYSGDFRNGADHSHWAASDGPITYTPFGAALTINKEGDSPTLTSMWYYFFGRLEVHLRAAPGKGIVSCIVLESDDLDEIDWEWIGGEPNYVQTNYFGKGNTTTYDRGGKSAVANTQGVSHVYTIDWNPSTVAWFIDGIQVRILNYEDAVGGRNYPQTPMRVKMGMWAGGDPKNANGTIAWAGGLTNYTQGPFTMYVEKVSVTNMHPAASYVYEDMSGSWQSILISNAPAPQRPVSGLGKNIKAGVGAVLDDDYDDAEDSSPQDEAVPTPTLTPSSGPMGDDYVPSKKDGDEHGLPVGPENTTGLAGSSSDGYPTSSSNSRAGYDATTVASRIPPSRTQPPNLVSASTSLILRNGIGMGTAAWGVCIGLGMLWAVI